MLQEIVVMKSISLKITTSQRERFIELNICDDGESDTSQNNYLSKREVYLTGDIGHLLQILSQNNYLSKREVYDWSSDYCSSTVEESQNNYLS